MELNTEVWGTGISEFNDFKYCASTMAQLVSAGKLPRDEIIDPSIYYCYSYSSKLNSYKYALVKMIRQEFGIEIQKKSSPFANFGFSRPYGYGSGIYPVDSSCVGLFKDDVTPAAFSSSRQMFIDYALKKLRACCYVKYCVTRGRNATYDIPIISTTGEMPLKDFINSQYYDTFLNSDLEHDGVFIYEMVWYLYYDGTDRSTRITPISVPNSIDAPTLWDNRTFKSVYFHDPNLQIRQGGHTNGVLITDIARYNGWYLFANTSDNWDVAVLQAPGSSSVVFISCILTPDKLMDTFHEFAYAGLFYTNNTTTAGSTTFSDDDLFLGEMQFGRTNGKYRQFSSSDPEEESERKARESNPDVLNSDDPSKRNTGYNGEDDPSQVDPNIYSLSTPLTPPAITTIDVFNRSFAMNITQIQALADWLWNADDDKMTEIIEGLQLMGENPMNGLIDCRLYPFAITDMIGYTGYQRIKIGRTLSDVGGIKLTNASNCIIDLGQCVFWDKEKDFLDYSPYTQARLYLPYCGWHSIDPAEFMGKRITGKLIVDVVTGACNCIIYANNIILINATGSIGVEIPMTGTDSAAFASQTLNAGMQAISQIVSAGAGAAAGSVGMAAGKNTMSGQMAQVQETQQSFGLLGAANSLWQAKTVPVQYEMSGAASPACANWLPQYAYFVIDRPVPLIPDNYGHTIGVACCESGPLSGYSGFTVCTNVDTSGFAQATEAERAELKALLEAGVYL